MFCCETLKCSANRYKYTVTHSYSPYTRCIILSDAQQRMGHIIVRTKRNIWIYTTVKHWLVITGQRYNIRTVGENLLNELKQQKSLHQKLRRLCIWEPVQCKQMVCLVSGVHCILMLIYFQLFHRNKLFQYVLDMLLNVVLKW